MNHLSNSRYNLDHFGTSSPASEIERPRPLAGGPPRNDETQSRAVGKALLRLLLRPLYQLYEIRLQRQVCIQPPPRHVGIILDGNRRYARKYGATWSPSDLFAWREEARRGVGVVLRVAHSGRHALPSCTTRLPDRSSGSTSPLDQLASVAGGRAGTNFL